MGAVAFRHFYVVGLRVDNGGVCVGDHLAVAVDKENAARLGYRLVRDKVAEIRTVNSYDKRAHFALYRNHKAQVTVKVNGRRDLRFVAFH